MNTEEKIWSGKQIWARCEAMADTRSRAHQVVALKN